MNFIVKIVSLYRVFKANISVWHTKLTHPKGISLKVNILSNFQLVACVGVFAEDVETIDEEDDINVENDVGVESVFSPSVSATCRAGMMTIKVESLMPNIFP